MKSKIIYLGALLLLVVVYSCNSNSSDNNEKAIDESDVQVSEANPNGDSELALLMRQLFVDGESLKIKIQTGEGNITQDYIDLMEKCHTATPTDPDVKTDQYTSFNNILINDAVELLNSTNDTKAGFNNVVNKCMACHEVFCPGPMKRIKKLYIQ